MPVHRLLVGDSAVELITCESIGICNADGLFRLVMLRCSHLRKTFQIQVYDFGQQQPSPVVAA